jgi:hypothetical protein
VLGEGLSAPTGAFEFLQKFWFQLQIEDLLGPGKIIGGVAFRALFTFGPSRRPGVALL